jgi:hypothetical protein
MEDLESDFAASAFRHLHAAVLDLTNEHTRRMAFLQQQNQALDQKLQAALQGQKASVPGNFDMGQPAKHAWSSSFSTPNGDGPCEEEPCEEPGESSTAEEPCSEQEPKSVVRELSKGSNLAEDFKALSFDQKVNRVVHSAKFDSFIGSVIIANTMVMSLQIEYNGRVFKEESMDACVACTVRNAPIELFFEVIEHVFTAIFLAELSLRLFCDGCRYWLSFSNALDGLIVIVSVTDSWVFGPMGSDTLGNVAVLRMIRLLRLAKVLRVVRVMKEFKSLRVLVAAVVNSVGALGWSMTLLFVLELVGAIFMAQVMQPFMEDEPKNAEAADLQKFIWSSFGTWANAMFTIFEITMAPGGFIKYRRLYEEVHALFGAFFVIYVCIVTFAVVRVITAMFLKATLSASDTEERDTAEVKSAQWSKCLRDMKRAEGEEFDEGTPNGAMRISIQELRVLLKMENLNQWLHDVGILPEEVVRMFNALDSNDILVMDQVNFGEFAHALKQMSVTDANSVLNLYETRDILLRVTRLGDQVKTLVDATSKQF